MQLRRETRSVVETRNGLPMNGVEKRRNAERALVNFVKESLFGSLEQRIPNLVGYGLNEVQFCCFEIEAYVRELPTPEIRNLYPSVLEVPVKFIVIT